jgi:AmmeMemoRadiSam system protein B
MFNRDIRESVVAGSFYPGNTSDLSAQINEYLNVAKSENIENIIGLVCPHAGYLYSGQIAACAYKQVLGKKFESAVIIAPSHSEYFEFNSVFNGKAYRTPLGIVEVDTVRCLKLANTSNYSDYIKASNYGHRSEHSLEVQLPFLQTVLKDIKIIPVVMGSQNRANVESLGNAISEVFSGDSILIIASTDLSHYHPYVVARELDKKAEDLIQSFNPQKFAEAIANEELEMCGGGPVAATMIASSSLGADSSRILCCKNSGDITGDKSAVVGYLSAAFYKS